MTPTIGQELEQNPAALLDEETFVTAMLASPPPIPAYYRYMAPLNRKGQEAPRFDALEELDAGELDAAIRGAEWVVDLRQRRVFAARHLRGTLNLELGANLTTYLGWIVPWEGKLVLLADDQAEIAEARRLVACIGRDIISGAALWATAVPALDGDPPKDGRVGTYPVASFSDLAKAWTNRSATRPQVFDVRHPHEWQAGHIAGAHHLPLPELVARKADVPASAPVWVHCGAGFRAAVAASLLSGWGASPVFVDDVWTNAVESGLPIMSGDDPAERRAS